MKVSSEVTTSADINDVSGDFRAEPGEPASLRQFVTLLRDYFPAITLAIVSVAVLYALYAVLSFLTAPSQRVTSTGFRLQFAGAEKGQYPNGLKFSTNDITSVPILLDVYNANELGRFVPFQQFARSVYVEQRNPAYESLAAEYRARLADPRLSPVDRERIQAEFDAKREAVTKADLAINYIAADQARRIPDRLVRKVLDDVLRGWSDWVVARKRGLLYDVPLLSPHSIDDVRVDPSNRLATVYALRARLIDVIEASAKLNDIPGISVVRTRDDQLSLADLQSRLRSLQRFEIERLADVVQSADVIGDRARAIQFVQTQLAYDERQARVHEYKVNAIRETLALYDSSAINANSSPIQPKSGRDDIAARTDTGAAARTQETVMPQLSDTFLDRLLQMTRRAADQEYRQELSGKMYEAATEIIPIQESIDFEQQLLNRLRGGPPVTAGATPEQITAQIEQAKTDLRILVDKFDQLHRLASRNLNPATQLYTQTFPAVTTIDRTASVSRLALWGVAIVLLSVPLAIAAAYLHRRFRYEQLEFAQSELQRR